MESVQLGSESMSQWVKCCRGRKAGDLILPSGQVGRRSGNQRGWPRTRLLLVGNFCNQNQTGRYGFRASDLFVVFVKVKEKNEAQENV